MSNVAIGYRNEVLTGPVIASNAAPGLGADQLQNDQGNAAIALQTTAGTTSLAILLPRASGTLWSWFGLFRTNLTSAAVVTWNVLNGNTPVAAVTSAAVAPGYGQAVAALPAPAAGDSMQVNISDPTNPDGSLNIPLMFAGTGLQPARNMNYSSAPGRAMKATSTETRSGGVIARTAWVRRTFDLQLSGIRPDEVAAIEALDMQARQGGNVLLLPNPDSPTLAREAVFGQCEPQTGLTYPYPSAVVRGWRATFTERL